MMAERRSSLTPAFTYSADAHRYRDVATGRYVPAKQVRQALDAVLDGSAGRMRAISTQLQEQRISLANWQQAMEREVKSAHLAGSATAKGGWANLSQADYGWTGQRVRTQYDYLDRMAQQIASGKQPLDGRLLARSELYAHAGRMTEREMEVRIGRQTGHTHEANELGPADHCSGCLSATSAGVVPIGSLTRPGARDCKTRCHCHVRTGWLEGGRLVA
jgi:hypothetical protein